MRRRSESRVDLQERQESFDFGNARPPIREAHPDERRSVLELLGRAFHDDPVAMHLFPDDASRSARWTRFSTLAMHRMGASARLLTTEGIRGAALWQEPGQTELGALPRAATTFRLLGLMGRGTARAIRLDAWTSPCRPVAPHYYLAALGTEHSERRRGIGSALIERVLTRADRDRLPVYLESSKARNVPFYQKHGFQIVTELHAANGLTVWPMLRRAR